MLNSFNRGKYNLHKFITMDSNGGLSNYCPFIGVPPRSAFKIDYPENEAWHWFSIIYTLIQPTWHLLDNLENCFWDGFDNEIAIFRDFIADGEMKCENSLIIRNNPYIISKFDWRTTQNDDDKFDTPKTQETPTQISAEKCLQKIIYSNFVFRKVLVGMAVIHPTE